MTHPLTPELDEALRRGEVVWVQPDGADRTYPVWHLWHGGSLYVVTGGAEQPLPTMSRARVIARDKERPLMRAGTWAADVETVPAGSAVWDEVVPLLHARRLNAADGEDQPARWARASTVLRFTPRG